MATFYILYFMQGHDLPSTPDMALVLVFLTTYVDIYVTVLRIRREYLCICDIIPTSFP